MKDKEKTLKIQLYLENKDFEIRKSDIHGFGLFSLKKIQKGTDMGPAFISYEIKSSYESYIGSNYDQKLKSKFVQTSAVRYINHNSENPNLKFYKFTDKIICAKVQRHINPGDEITTDYREACRLSGVEEPEWIIKLNSVMEKN